MFSLVLRNELQERHERAIKCNHDSPSYSNNSIAVSTTTVFLAINSVAINRGEEAFQNVLERQREIYKLFESSQIGPILFTVYINQYYTI